MLWELKLAGTLPDLRYPPLSGTLHVHGCVPPLCMCMAVSLLCARAWLCPSSVHVHGYVPPLYTCICMAVSLLCARAWLCPSSVHVHGCVPLCTCMCMAVSLLCARAWLCPSSVHVHGCVPPLCTCMCMAVQVSSSTLQGETCVLSNGVNLNTKHSQWHTLCIVHWDILHIAII